MHQQAKRFGTAIAALLGSALATTATAGTAPQEALRAYYCFDQGLAADCSGHGNNGLLFGDVTAAPGKVGSGAHFGGYTSVGYIQVPNSPSLTLTDEFTIAYWAKIESFAGEDAYAQYVPYGIQLPLNKSHDQTGLITAFDGFPDGTALSTGAVFSGGSGSVGANYSPYALNQWVHVAYTYSHGTGTLALYINGALTTSASLPGLDLTQFSQNDLFIGAQAPLFGSQLYQYPFDGTLDEIRIYDKALARAAILAMYIKGVRGEP